MSQTANQDQLREALRSHKVLLDTSFATHKSFDQFLKDYDADLQGSRILVPSEVVQDLQQLATMDDDRLQAARHAMRCLAQAIDKGIAEVRGVQNVSGAAVTDHVIANVVDKHISQHSILILTNDQTLRDWVHAKKRNDGLSTRNSILVVRFEPRSGAPQIWVDEKGQPNRRYEQPPVIQAFPPRPGRPRREGAVILPPPFSSNSQLDDGLSTELQAKEEIERSGRVYLSNGKAVRLLKVLGSGGEGTVYQTDEPSVLCKIYHAERLTDGARRKIELMITRRINHPAICWPIDAVRDSQGVFRGFLMPQGSGEPLAHGLFIPISWLAKHPTWTRRDSVRLAISILQGIDYLHQMNVLLGDINPMNILIKDANTIYFVDCDSFQLEGFPCPVGSINFVAPEIQGQDFARFLRTLEHELFAVATLVFMIMVPGKTPYTHQGGADGAANIRKMHFPYPLGEKKSKGAPEGPWRFCWSHLNRALKEAFYVSFHSECRGQPRVTISEWLRLFRNYGHTLANNANVFTGPMPCLGYDLSLLPRNKRYWMDDDGVVRPYPIPQDGETDLQRSVRMLAGTSRQAPIRNQSTAARRGTAYSTRPRAPQPRARVPQQRKHIASHSPTSAGNQALSYAPVSVQPPPTRAGAAEWYATRMFWPITAPVKAILEVAGVGIVGSILGAVGLGLVCMVFGNYHGFRLGALWGAGIGTLIGAFLAWITVINVDEGILTVGAIGVVGGGAAGGLLSGTGVWAVAGAVLGIIFGLFCRHLQIGEVKAAEYMHSWWGQ